ncbi:MAG TPA: hypothetical protein VFP66_12815 [Candidatus Limnocylindrales bacterium]|nr:hypothetical protein [Candidatus Limnocylindrales bacterium]
MTHRYTLLIRGTVISGRDEPDVPAIAWAADTVIALGSDDDVRGISRGDSHVIDLRGATVVALDGPDVLWTPDATLEVGGHADLAVLESDPRRMDAPAGQRMSALAVVRGGRVVAGRLPGEPSHRARPKAPLAEH